MTPINPATDFHVGYQFVIEKRVPLMPSRQAPSDPAAPPNSAKWLPAGSHLEILEVSTDQGQTWYRVRAKVGDDAGYSGWVYGVALVGKVKVDLESWSKAEDRLYKRYMAEFAASKGLSVEQIDELVIEGAKKQWWMKKETAH